MPPSEDADTPDRAASAATRPAAAGDGDTGGAAARRCRLAREIASVVLDVPVEEIARPNRSIAATCRARHLAIYLAHVAFQVPLSAVATSFGRDRTSVAHAIRRIEDERDDAGFERLVARLERFAEACLGASSAEGTEG